MSIYEDITTCLEEGKELVLATIVDGSGSVPRGAGARMAVLPGAGIFGTIGGGAVEFESEKLGRQLLAERQSKVQEFCLAPNEAADLGMVCGGNVTVHFQYLDPKDQKLRALLQETIRLQGMNQDSWVVTWFTAAGSWEMALLNQEHEIVCQTDQFAAEAETLSGLAKSHSILREIPGGFYYCQPLVRSGRVYIFGGGHISRQLVPVLDHVFFSSVVIDSREEFSNPEMFPQAKATMCFDFEDALSHIKVRENDYVVIITRGHLFDYTVLSQMLRTPACYIGMVGSRRKIHTTYEKLKAEGFTEEDLSRVHAPIGLPIGGETPEEIAISIAAEMIQVRTEKNGR